jgi:hypothetical protein
MRARTATPELPKRDWRRARPGAASALLATAAAIVAALAVANELGAEPLDPTLPHRVNAAAPRGAAVSERLDPAGTQVTSVRLPTRPSIAFQVRLPGPIIGAPVADERGRLLVAHGSGRLTELDGLGHTTFSIRLGGEPVGAPVLLGGERALAATRDATLVSVRRDGRIGARLKLPFAELEGSFVATPASDGGAIVAAGARYARVDATFSLTHAGAASSPIAAVFAWRGSTLLVERDGRILARTGALDAVELGRFGAPVAHVARAGDRLFALGGAHDLLVHDLAKRTTERRFSEPALELRDLTLGEGGSVRLLGGRGVLLEVDEAGREMLRLGLLPDGAGAESSSLVADRAGTVLAVMSGAPLVFVTREGDVLPVSGTGCPDPLRPTPLRDGAVLSGCRSGVLRLLSDRPR